ncbi:MAG: hypothetical protein Kapaf2KO_18930 [Candidatus Kapaibacteriales bacterium]
MSRHYNTILFLLILLGVSLTASAKDYYLRLENESQIESLMSKLEEDYSAELVIRLLTTEQALYGMSKGLAIAPSKYVGSQSLINSFLTDTEKKLIRSIRVSIDDIYVFHEEKFAAFLAEKYDEIEFAEPCQVLEKHCAKYNDPLKDSQSLLNAIKLCEASNVTEGSTSVIIALSDDGLNSDHEDLAGQIWRNNGETLNGIDDDGNGFIDDFEGYSFMDDGGGHGSVDISDNHGTTVAGIFATAPNNDKGIIGTGLKSKIFPIRVVAFDDPEPIIFGYESIIYAAIMGFDIINCSWGSARTYSVFAEDIMDFANERNLTVVSSAGNRSNSDPGAQVRNVEQLPSRLPGVISIGQVGDSGSISSTGNISPSTDLFAPGAGNTTIRHNQDDSYTTADNGTSFSAPVVAGVAGLVKSVYPNINNYQMEAHLRITADDISAINDNLNFEPGMVNAFRAVSEDPYQKPALRVEGYYFTDNEGNLIARPNTDTDYRLKVKVRNYSRALANAGIAISDITGLIQSNGNIEFIDATQTGININTDEVAELDFGVKVKRPTDSKNMIKLNISADIDGELFEDRLLFSLYNDPKKTDFFNESIGISVFDGGEIGYSKVVTFDEDRNNDFHGLGIYLSNEANLLYEGLIFASERETGQILVPESRVSGQFSAFETVETFDKDNAEVNDKLILKPAGSANSLNIRIANSVNTGMAGEPYIRFDTEANNLNPEGLFNVGIGHYLDLDLKRNDTFDAINNIAYDTSDEIPSIIENAALATIANPDSSIYLSVGVVGYSDQIIPQINIKPTSQLTGANADQLRDAIEDGVDISGVSESTDLALVAGFNVNGIWNAGDTKRCRICYGGGSTEEESITNTVICMQSPISVEEEYTETPSKGIMLTYSDVLGEVGKVIEIYSLDGKLVYSGEGLVEVQMIGSGYYSVRIGDGKNRNTSVYPVLINL